MAEKLRWIVPYLLVIAVAAYCYWLTYSFDYAARAGQIGPGFWPRAVLGVAVAASLYEILKRLLFTRSKSEGEAESGGPLPVDIAAEEEVKAAPTMRSFNGLLIAGMALSVAYVAFIKILGFVLCTLIYLAAFMILGRYRRLGVIALNSAIGTVVVVLVFMKLVYVSLPLGSGVFETITLKILSLFGIS
jgi:hypothetical protein